MKKGSLFLGLLLCITFVGCGENLSTPSFEREIIYRLENFYIDRIFEVEITHLDSVNTYYIDGKSYYHLESETTVLKYTFLDVFFC